MPSLKIARDSGYADRLRAYHVILDGLKVGEVRNGETREFAVSSGRHRISLKIDWCGSNAIEFTVAGEDQLSFRVKSNLRGIKVFAAFWYVIFDRSSYLVLERNS